MDAEAGEKGQERVSVSGSVYKAEGNAPEVTLYTKYQCTLCDKVSVSSPMVDSDTPGQFTLC